MSSGAVRFTNLIVATPRVRQRRRSRSGRGCRMPAGSRWPASWSISSTRWPRRPTSRSPRRSAYRSRASWLPWRLALLFYAGALGLLILELSGQPTFLKYPISYYQPPPALRAPNYAPPVFHTELFEILWMIAGTFALLGICQPFACDMAKIFRRNFSLGFSGPAESAGRSARRVPECSPAGGRRGSWAASLPMPPSASRSTRSGADRLFGIWAGWLVVAFGVLVGTLLVHILFEAGGPVWAIAKLSFKEASRSGLLWLFLLVLVPFAFQNVWMAKTKPVDEVRTLVDVTSLWMAIHRRLGGPLRVVLRHPQRHQEPQHLHGRFEADRAASKSSWVDSSAT